MVVKHNEVYLGDCLDILPRIEPNTVDLIYLDPPFFTGKIHKGILKNTNDVLSFSDIWKSSSEYAEFLYNRILPCKFLLKDTGSIFVHCDRNSTHIIRQILEVIFGEDNFQSEIIWSYKRWSNSKKGLLNQHQNILFFSKSDQFKWHQEYVEYSPTTNLDQILQKRSRSENGQSIYAKDSDGDVIYGGTKKGVPLGDVWSIPFLNPKAKERTGYPTQKPLILLEKIIGLTTDKNDVVLDPFCGSGTTLIAANRLERKYIGIDISEDAIKVTKDRLKNPIKTESFLLKKGIDSYINNDPWVEKHLQYFKYSRVQRNKGIDGILTEEIGGLPVFLKVQSKTESLLDAYNLLQKALLSKKNSKGIIIQTKEDLLIDVSNNIQIFKSY